MGTSALRSRLAVAALFALPLAACPGPRAPELPSPGHEDGGAPSPAACGGLDAAACRRAAGLVSAASGFGNVRHEVLLDPTSSLVPGRGIERIEGGAYRVLPTRCAEERAPRVASVDATTIDFSYVGVSIDGALISADAELAPWLSVGAEASERRIALVALAFVRDVDPQFFSASPEVSLAGESCGCGRATHFVGAVKSGGLVSYEMTVRAGEIHGRALDFVKARLAKGDARVKQTVVGGLEVEGLEGLAAGAGAGAGPGPGALAVKPLSFKVRNPVPVAFAVYPLADVCRFAFPAPEVSPEVVDFGDVPFGTEAARLLHVVNRAPVELRATLGEATYAVPALGSTDVPLTWTPRGQALGCEVQTREETLAFVPRDASAPVSPKMQSVRVVARARSGKATFTRHEHVDTGVHRKPDYAATSRVWACPPDYALASCRTEKAECGDGRCQSDGYAVNAGPEGNGCRFACTGPDGLIPGLSSNFCRFDAVMECRLRCR